MSKYLNVIFAKFSIFLKFMDTGWIFCCYVTMFCSCCLSTVETLIEWLHETLYIQ